MSLHEGPGACGNPDARSLLRRSVHSPSIRRMPPWERLPAAMETPMSLWTLQVAAGSRSHGLVMTLGARPEQGGD